MSVTAERILMDVTAVPPDRRGVGRYVDALVPALVDAGASMYVVCQPRDTAYYESRGAEAISGGRGVERLAARFAWEQTGLPALIRKLRPDVLHSPHYTQPAIAFCATAVTLHDATFFTAPEVHGRVKGPFFRAATRIALRHADAVIVPSRATAEELVRVARASAGHVQVAHHGVDPAVFSPPGPEAIERARASAGVPPGRRYIAFLGTLEPRKNLPALVAAYVLSFADRPDPPTLVLAGGPGWDHELEAAIDAVPAHLEVVRPGYLPLGDLAGYLAGAELVAYPSLGEGFGLPVLEAMACGAAVLTTRRLALPEVGGDAVAYCGIAAPSIATALTALLDAPDRRAALSRLGVERAATFTWADCALAHREAFDAAFARHRRAAA